MKGPRHDLRRGALRRSVGAVLALMVFGSVCVAPPLAAARKGEEAAEQQEEEVDYVGLAARMIKDGHFDRARSLLEQVDVSKPGIELPRFYTLKGLALQQDKQYAQALASFQKAVASGQEEPVVFLYLAQAHYGLKDYKGVIGALRKAGKTGRDVPGTFLMRSQAHWELGQHAQAVAALDEGARAFPDESGFTRTKLFYLIDLGLFQEVAQVGEKYLSRPGVSADDYAAVGEGLRRSKQFKKARDVLETAHLKFPADEKITILLAHTYLDDGHPLIGAMLFEDASRLDPKYALEAAELYLRAGRYERALSLNSRILDQKDKIKQRLSILLKQERHAMIAAMAPRLSRLGLLQDENIRYALAYGYFKTGEFGKAEQHLKHITEARLFESALQLRRAMQTCAEAGWECS